MSSSLVHAQARSVLMPLERSILDKYQQHITSQDSTIDQIKLLRDQEQMLFQLKKALRDPKDNTAKRFQEPKKERSSDLSTVQTNVSFVEEKTLSWEEVFQEVGEKCSQECYDQVRYIFDEYQRIARIQEEARYFETMYQRAKNQVSQLRIKLSEKEFRITELDVILANAFSNPELQQLKAQRASLVQFSKQLEAKEYRMTKTQTANLLREAHLKNHQQRLQSQQQTLNKERAALQKQRALIDLGWDTLIHEVDPFGEFTQDVRRMYLDNVSEQRERVKQELQLLTKKHQKIDELIGRVEEMSMLQY